MGLFDNNWFAKGTGADDWLTSERAARKKRQEDQDSQIAQQLKDEQTNVSAGKNPDGSEKAPSRNIFQKVGGFVEDAAKDVYRQGKETVVDTIKTAKGIGATHATNENTKAVQQNNKEWNDYMNKVLGDAPNADANPEVHAKWNSPEVQEKLKEFKYKAHLLQGTEGNLKPEELPKSATSWKDQPATVPEGDKIFYGKNASLTGKDGQPLLKPQGPTDPYQQYRDKALSEQTRQDTKNFQGVDAHKFGLAAAETFLNVATLGEGTGLFQGGKALAKEGVEQGVKAGIKTGVKEGLKAAVGTTAKDLAKNAGKDALIGGAYGVTQTLRQADKEGKSYSDLGLNDFGKNVLLGASIGTVAPVVLKGAGHLAGVTDSAAGRVVSNTLKDTKLGEHQAMTRALKQIGEDGIFGTLNKSLNRAGTKITYGISDALNKTKIGSKAIDLKDDFLSKWVTNFSPLYKAIKRSDFEGKTTGGYLAAREAIGNSNRALSYAQDFIDNNENMQQLAGNIAGRDKDLVKARGQFDEYAKVKSELDLQAAGKKTFSKAKTADLQARMAAFDGDKAVGEGYKNLVGFYKDLNDFRLDNGLISKDAHAAFKDEGFDYVRQQRELPDWMLDKPGGSGAGSKASISGSEAIQKRNKYASAELLSPMETALRTAQVAHVEAYRNKAAQTVYDLLHEGGNADLIRTTDMVREKQAILKDLHDGKPIVTKMQQTLRTQNKSVRRLQSQMNQLSKEGLAESLAKQGADDTPQAFRYVNIDEVKNPKRTTKPTMSSVGTPREITGTATTRLGIEGGADTRKMVKALVTEDPARLKQIRAMIEKRDEKLTPLLDSIEVMNRDLHDKFAERSGMYQTARGLKTDVKKGGMTSLSFLKDGEENIAKIDPDIASAVHNWDKQQQNVLNNVLRFSNNVFKYGTTGANVGFALPNFVADQVSSAINSKALMATHNPVNFVHSLFMSLGKPLNSEDHEILRGYLSANKGQLNINQYTKSAAADKLANNVIKDAASKGQKLYTTISHPKEALRTLFDATEGAVGLTENLTRIQNYRGTLLKAGEKMSSEDATKVANQAARENTVDFLEMGDYGRVINSFIPYFNAGIQGTRTMLRNASERPASFAAKTAALVGAPVAASTVWNLSDPHRKAIYDTIPDYVKETNFVVVTPGAKWNEEKKKWDGVILMKKPQGFKEFAEPVRQFLEYKSQDPNSGLGDFIKDKKGDLTHDFTNAMTPIDFSSPDKFLSSVTPQILKPTAQAILNKEFFTGEDIVKGNLQDQAPADQKYDQYSRLSAHIAGMFNTSPLKVDSWIKNTFGEVGTNVQNLADSVDNKNKNSVGGRSLTESIERRFSGAPGGADTDAFYNTYNPSYSARKVTSSKVTDLVKAGRINEAKRRAEEYNSSIKDRFRPFIERYKSSPNYDPAWDDKINSLLIKTSDGAFEARRKQK